MRIPTRFPTIFGLILCILVVGGVIFFAEQNFRKPSKASEPRVPESVRITNITDTTFSVSWITRSPASGSVLVATKGKSNRIYSDERDTAGKPGLYTSHLVTVRDAVAYSEYSLKIISNGKQYTDNGSPYSFTTAPTLPPNSNPLGEPAYGTVWTATDVPAEGVLVYLTLDGGQELSSLSKLSGIWLVPLSQVRTKDLSAYLSLTGRVTETLVVQYGDQESFATTDTLNDSPVPEILPGKIYDFRKLQAISPASVLAQKKVQQNPQDAPLTGGSAVLGTTSQKKYTVTLVTPKNGSAVPTTLPLFSGTGIPQKFVGISIGLTNPVSGSARVDSSGLWNFTPPKPLPIGTGSVTITTVDDKGKPVALTHSFEILKSGTQVLGDATPSATLTPVVSITPTPEITPESTVSAEPPPVSGSPLPTILLILLGLGLFTGGTLVVRKEA
jgi:hypothetical protein